MVDVIDETFVVAPPAALAARLREPALWRRWWPDLRLAVFDDRGDAGLRWTVTGALVGSAEVWLEAVGDGTLLHYYLRADPAGERVADGAAAQRRAARRARRVREAHVRALKRHVNALKDELERGRPPGEPPEPVAVAPRPGRQGAVKPGAVPADD